MQLQVIGHDPADPDSHTPEQLLAQADVLVLGTDPAYAGVDCRVRAAVGRPRAGPAVAGRDLGKRSAGAGDAGLSSRSGRPAPDDRAAKAPTLKGRVMVVCEARLRHWQPWVDTLCTALQAECVRRRSITTR